MYLSKFLRALDNRKPLILITMSTARFMASHFSKVNQLSSNGNNKIKAIKRRLKEYLAANDAISNCLSFA